MQVKTGSKVIICTGCRRVFNFAHIGTTAKTLAYPAGIKQIGIECPHCGYFAHICYLSEELEAMHDPKADRKTRRLYKRKFDKLQRWVERKLKARENGRYTSS